MKIQALLLGACVAAAADGHADYLDGYGEAPYEPCGYCHEIDGNPRMPAFPRLAGQQGPYIEKQLKDFRVGRRTGPMQGTAEMLTDDAIRELAAYFSANEAAVSDLQPQPAAERSLARSLYQRGDPARGLPACGACHGLDGLGRGAIPRLAGQHGEYLRAQISRFSNGQRGNDPDGQMRRIAGLLIAAEIEALGDYLERLPSSAR